ncbi:serine/threonine-protein kinase Stk1 [Pseudomonas asturiensis]|uniref:Serine/threonine-protein kinase Stk1 n=1 Tax=Pseudomonas asturiensis TaxID=1190415 RepID=A0A1M7JEA8_9PSED|nr:serine/threonine-protein kinase [Pseudomonas asturiensis]SHM51326.1 serine/threonine-protein kinase Stk1 [Pseudomonas asturiensis]
MPDVLSGRYSIERLLGTGGMGAVYQARDLLHEQLGEPEPAIAIKVLNDDLVKAPDAAALLYSEFALTRHLHHPHVIRPYAFEVDADSDRAFMTLELMRGMRLDQWLHRRPHGLPWDQCREVAIALLDALAHVHERGVVHGDVKPGNVMLTERGVRLFDFGLGRPVDGVLDGLPQLDRQRLKAWTPCYAAHEILEGGPPTSQADVYAAALVVYEMAAGRQGSSIVGSGTRCAVAALEKPAGMPSGYWSSLRQALMSDGRDRPISARQLHRVFQAAPHSRLRQWFKR